jgi:O-antigen/teichoic acid export membrane protein
MVLYGEVARMGPDRAWAVNRRVLLTLSALMIGVSLGAFLTAPTLIPFTFGDDFSSAVPVFQVLVFGLVFQTFSALMAPQWIGRGLFWQASVLAVSLGICNVAASIPLVRAYGMKGAAFSILGVYTISAISNGVMALWVNRKVSSDPQATEAPPSAVAEPADR